MLSYDDEYEIDSLPIHNAAMFRKVSGAYTTIANASTVFDYLPDNFNIDDCFIVGVANTPLARSWWHNIIFNVGTPLVADAVTAIYEYTYVYNSDSWKELPNVIDTTNIFQNAGEGGIYFEHPLDSLRGLVNGASRIYVRIRITGVTNPSEGGANNTDKVKVRTGDLRHTDVATRTLAQLYAADIA